MKTNGVAFNEEEREESEKKGDEELKILDVDCFSLLPARFEGPATNLGPCGR